MNRSIRWAIVVAWLLGWSSGPSRAGEPTPSDPPDYKIVYWFDWSDPVRTFRHHAYNILKGEFPAKAVSHWREELRRTHPNYAVLIRQVRRADYPGKTDEEMVNAAVAQQFSEVLQIASVPGPWPSPGPSATGIATTHRQALRPVWPSNPDLGFDFSQRPIDRIYPSSRRPLGSAGFRMGPGPTPTPFPMPYPRPHP